MNERARPAGNQQGFGPGFGFGLALTLLFCGGCWDEIRSEPPPEAIEAAPETPASAQSPAEGPTAPEEPAVEHATSTPVDPVENGSDEGEPPASPPSNEVEEQPDSDPFSLTPPEQATPDVPLPDKGTVATAIETPTDEAPASTDPPPTVDPFEQPDNSPPTAEDRRRVWEAASKWSLAAAIYAKGLAASRSEPILKQAEEAAAAIGVSLPPLPTGDDANREALVIESLKGETAKELVRRIGERFTPAEAAAAELAIGTQVLLLTYSPRSDSAKEHAEAMRRAAEASGLAAELWQTLLKRLDDRAPFIVVRVAVFDFHRRTAKHLSGK